LTKLFYLLIKYFADLLRFFNESKFYKCKAINCFRRL